MGIEYILLICGSFCTIGLGINAFFLKGIYDKIATVEVSQATIIANSRAKDERIKNLEQNEKDIFHRLNLLEREVLK